MEAVGIDQKKCKGFNFSGGGNTDKKETLDLKKDIWEKIIEMCNGNVELAKKTLQKHTSFGDFAGYTDINKVKEKPLAILKSKVDKAYTEYLDKLEDNKGNNDNDTNN